MEYDLSGTQEKLSNISTALLKKPVDYSGT